MNQLIKIEITDQGGQAVNTRLLHTELGIKKDYSDWFKQQVDRLGLIEKSDFTPWEGKSTGGRPGTDYIVPLDIGKHICMMSGGEKAHKLRSYFIEVERAWNSPEQVMARALQFADRKINNLQATLEEQKPKVLFAEALEVSNSTILIGELAKILRQNGIDIGQNRLFAKLRSEGYLIKYGEGYNQPTQYSMDLRLFEIKKRVIGNPDGSMRAITTTKVTPRGMIYFINRFKQTA